MTIKIEDLLRLVSELQARGPAGGDMDENLEYELDWFASHGFDENVYRELTAYAAEAFGRVMTFIINQSEDEGMVRIGPVGIVTSEMITQGAIAGMLGMFELGFETHEQYGKSLKGPKSHD